MFNKIISQKILSLLGVASIVALVAALGLTTYLTGEETRVPIGATSNGNGPTATPTCTPPAGTPTPYPDQPCISIHLLSGANAENPEIDWYEMPDGSWNNPNYPSSNYYKVLLQVCNDYHEEIHSSSFVQTYDNTYISRASGGHGSPGALEPGQCTAGILLEFYMYPNQWGEGFFTQAKYAAMGREICGPIGGCKGCYDDDFQKITFGTAEPTNTPTPTATLTPTPPTVCGSGNCNGCCDPNNTCQPGDTNTACGKNGAQCVNCVPTNNVCEAATGICIAPTVSPTICDSTNCTGCCLNNVCYQGTSDTQCGIGGNLCTTCPSGYKCTSGSCAPPTPTPTPICLPYGSDCDRTSPANPCCSPATCEQTGTQETTCVKLCAKDSDCPPDYPLCLVPGGFCWTSTPTATPTPTLTPIPTLTPGIEQICCCGYEDCTTCSWLDETGCQMAGDYVCDNSNCDSCKLLGEDWVCWTAGFPCPGETQAPPDGTCYVDTLSSVTCCKPPPVCPTIAAPGNVGIQTVAPIGANAFLAFANAADINGDGKIDGADASALVSSWGKKKGEAGFNANADLNNDGKVNAVDASILVSNWTE